VTVTDGERVDVVVAGGRLATFRLGADPAAPPVIAIHGITSTSRTWLAIARALEDRASLIALDLRGRGGSNALPPPFGIDAHVRDVIAVLDHFGLDRGVIAAIRWARTSPLAWRRCIPTGSTASCSSTAG
jgi:pimeloyl-ACP methyl ester carboxylesterase